MCLYFLVNVFHRHIYKWCFNSEKLKHHSAPIFLVIMLADISFLECNSMSPLSFWGSDPSQFYLYTTHQHSVNNNNILWRQQRSKNKNKNISLDFQALPIDKDAITFLKRYWRAELKCWRIVYCKCLNQSKQPVKGQHNSPLICTSTFAKPSNKLPQELQQQLL